MFIEVLETYDRSISRKHDACCDSGQLRGVLISYLVTFVRCEVPKKLVYVGIRACVTNIPWEGFTCRIIFLRLLLYAIGIWAKSVYIIPRWWR